MSKTAIIIIGLALGAALTAVFFALNPLSQTKRPPDSAGPSGPPQISEPTTPQPKEPITFCPALYAPVCADNNKTYGNDCEARREGRTVQYSGMCH